MKLIMLCPIFITLLFVAGILLLTLSYDIVPKKNVLNEPNFTSLVLLLPNIAYSDMLFILQLAHTASSACQLQNK